MQELDWLMAREFRAFVLMPFSEPYNSYYQTLFRPALEQAGFKVTRADDLFSPRPIMDSIIASIEAADLLLCEMSGRNPNVFYELGLAHAIGKPVILVSQSEDDIPFDLRHIRVIIYNHKDAEWGTKLRQAITSAAEQVLLRPSARWPPALVPRAVLHRDVRVLHGRRETVELLAEVAARAEKNDLLFGSCNTCSDYPRAFYDELAKAVDRGARILFIAQDRPDSASFIRYILKLKHVNSQAVQIFRSSAAYLRLLGIAGKEVILALPLDHAFIGLHFTEPRVPEFLKLAFDELAANSAEVQAS